MSSIEELLKDPAKLKSGQVSDSTTNDGGKTSIKIEEVSTKQKLEKKMKEISIKETESSAKSIATSSGVPYIDLIGFPISQETIAIIPKDKSISMRVICFLYIGEEMRIGTTEPENEEIKEYAYQLGENNRAKVEIYKISENSLKEAQKVYDKIPVRAKKIEGVSVSEEDLNKYTDIGRDFKKLNETVKKTNISDMVSLVIAAALESGSSDIHIEAEEKDVKIRLRVDGILHDAAEIEKDKWSKIISRIKLLAGLKINISDKPQDGRFSIATKEDKIDVRTSTLPTAYGESVVMRILNSSAAGVDFDKLGLIGLAAKRLEEQMARPNGMIITTGPTGSGKTTTLYSILFQLNKEGTKIITLEDPIEYKLKGINQSQIEHSKNYDFAKGLRSILRQDPDVVMVGEIRDIETAEIAIQAALTGHLVISTIHTNSAAGAIPRFMSMGVKPFLLAPALNAVIGQRLVRRICQDCKIEYEAKPEELENAKKILESIPEGHPDRPDLSNLQFYTGKGCEKCNEMKYKGRVGIYEIMVMNKEIEQVILSEKLSVTQMEELAIKNQMLTMAQDGLIKAMKGMTTLEEVFRVSE